MHRTGTKGPDPDSVHIGAQYYTAQIPTTLKGFVSNIGNIVGNDNIGQIYGVIERTVFNGEQTIGKRDFGYCRKIEGIRSDYRNRIAVDRIGNDYNAA